MKLPVLSSRDGHGLPRRARRLHAHGHVQELGRPERVRHNHDLVAVGASGRHAGPHGRQGPRDYQLRGYDDVRHQALGRPARAARGLEPQGSGRSGRDAGRPGNVVLEARPVRDVARVRPAQPRGPLDGDGAHAQELAVPHVQRAEFHGHDVSGLTLDSSTDDGLAKNTLVNVKRAIVEHSDYSKDKGGYTGAATSEVAISDITIDGLSGSATNLFDVVANPKAVSDWKWTRISVTAKAKGACKGQPSGVTCA